MGVVPDFSSANRRRNLRPLAIFLKFPANRQA
jgi:hypothetical protein